MKNTFILCGDTTRITTKSGREILISTSCVDRVRPYTWCIEGTGYAMTRTGGHALKLHRLLLNPQKGEFVDHIDGNTLNNCLDNLRICRKQQNEFNARIRADNTSGYKGVCRFGNTGKWRAFINLNGKQYSLGLFTKKDEAADMYNCAAPIFFGEFARLNQINADSRRCEHER